MGFCEEKDVAAGKEMPPSCSASWCRQWPLLLMVKARNRKIFKGPISIFTDKSVRVDMELMEK
jgi:hypothetical protein